MAALITAADLAKHIQQGIPAGLATDQADEAIRDATAAISVECRRDITAITLPAEQQWKLDAARLVCKRAAARAFQNPNARQSYTGPDGLTYQAPSGLPAVVLSNSEIDQLAPLVDYTGLYG